MFNPEMMEALAQQLEPPKADFLKAYLADSGRRPIEVIAGQTGWSQASSYRILKEAREIVGIDQIPSPKDLRRLAIRRVFQNLSENKAKSLARQAGFSESTIYRAKRELRENEEVIV